MKKQAILLAALIGAASAQAQTAAPYYVTVAGGQSHFNVDCSGASSCDSSDTGVKLVGGYQFGNGLSLELGYIDFGKASARLGTSSQSLKANAFMLGGAYAMPLNSDWGLNVRLGLAQVKTKLDETTGALRDSASQSKAKVYAGFGVTYAATKTIKVDLGIDSTQGEVQGSKGTLRLISAGATFAF